MLSDAGEGAECMPSLGGPLIAESYERGELEIHFHFRLAKGVVADYCAILKRTDGDLCVPNNAEVHFESAARATLAPRLAEAVADRPDEAQTLVPIYAGELVEDVEVVVPSLVRLQLLDSCPHRDSLDFPDFVHSASGAVPAAGVFVGLEEGGFGAVDGEAGGARRLAPLILEGESPQ